MALRMNCVTEADRDVLRAGLNQILERRYQTGMRIKTRPGMSWDALQDGARLLLKEINGTPVCGETRMSDVEDVAFLIVNDLRRGDDEKARDWYGELQGKRYTPELEEILRGTLSVDEFRRLKE